MVFPNRKYLKPLNLHHGGTKLVRPHAGRMVFSGPDYLRDHRMTVEPDLFVIGNGKLPPLATSDAHYLWRAAPNTPFPVTRDQSAGEVGWFNKPLPKIPETRKVTKPSSEIEPNTSGLQLSGKAIKT